MLWRKPVGINWMQKYKCYISFIPPNNQCQGTDGNRDYYALPKLLFIQNMRSNWLPLLVNMFECHFPVNINSSLSCASEINMLMQYSVYRFFQRGVQRRCRGRVQWLYCRSAIECRVWLSGIWSILLVCVFHHVITSVNNTFFNISSRLRNTWIYNDHLSGAIVHLDNHFHICCFFYLHPVCASVLALNVVFFNVVTPCFFYISVIEKNDFSKIRDMVFKYTNI